jgi:hypothetical protein
MIKELNYINKIINLLDPLNFKLSDLLYENGRLELLVFKSEKYAIILKVVNFNLSYELDIYSNTKRIHKEKFKPNDFILNVMFEILEEFFKQELSDSKLDS